MGILTSFSIRLRWKHSYLCNLQNTGKPGQPNRKRPVGKNSKTKENGRNHQDGETESEEEDTKVTDNCDKLQDSMPGEKKPPEMANGHKEQEEKPSGVDMNMEAQENGGDEAMEMNGGGGEEEEEKVRTLQNSVHESCGDAQEKDQKDEANLGQNSRARGKVAEGKTELMNNTAFVLKYKTFYICRFRNGLAGTLTDLCEIYRLIYTLCKEVKRNLAMLRCWE